MRGHFREVKPSATKRLKRENSSTRVKLEVRFRATDSSSLPTNEDAIENSLQNEAKRENRTWTQPEVKGTKSHL